jgi:hypothetical protein
MRRIKKLNTTASLSRRSRLAKFILISSQTASSVLACGLDRIARAAYKAGADTPSIIDTPHRSKYLDIGEGLGGNSENNCRFRYFCTQAPRGSNVPRTPLGC